MHPAMPVLGIELAPVNTFISQYLQHTETHRANTQYLDMPYTVQTQHYSADSSHTVENGVTGRHLVPLCTLAPAQPTAPQGNNYITVQRPQTLSVVST